MVDSEVVYDRYLPPRSGYRGPIVDSPAPRMLTLVMFLLTEFLESWCYSQARAYHLLTDGSLAMRWSAERGFSCSQMDVMPFCVATRSMMNTFSNTHVTLKRRQVL